MAGAQVGIDFGLNLFGVLCVGFITAVGGGVLRGMGRTLPPAVFNFVAWYVVGLPLAWHWAITLGHGLAGLWWALAVGLAGVAALLVLWIHRFGPARG